MKMLVEFDPPAGASVEEIQKFITDWLQCGGGCRHPNDPLFHSLENVKVSKPGLWNFRKHDGEVR